MLVVAGLMVCPRFQEWVPYPSKWCQDWNNLYGNILIIQTDSVWNHLKPGSVFHLADNAASKQMECATVTDTGETKYSPNPLASLHHDTSAHTYNQPQDHKQSTRQAS